MIFVDRVRAASVVLVAAAALAAAALPAAASQCVDCDRDGLTNMEEHAYGTDLDNPDTDFDGVDDGYEVNVLGTDPLWANPMSNGGALSGADSDGDGLYDDDELAVYATDPYNWDTDFDGYGDGDEVYRGWSPIGGGCNALGCG